MDVSEAISKRRSVRKFLEVPLNWEQVGRILDAGRLAPTAGNVQDVRFCVVVDPTVREKIAEACFQQFWMTKAPVHIVIGVEPTKTEQFYGKRGKEVYAVQDASAAAMAMLLAVEEQGLATCWVSAFEESQLKRAVQMPESATPMAVLPIGYPDESPKAPLKFGIESLVLINSWNSRFLHMRDLTGEFSNSVEAALKKGKDIIEKAKQHLKRV